MNNENQGGVATQATGAEQEQKALINATPQQFTELQQAYNSASSVVTGRPFLICMLASSPRWTAITIAEFLGITHLDVTRATSAWNEGGLSGLRTLGR